jgi:hypothetical protein
LCVQIDLQQRDQRIKRFIRPITVGRQSDLVAVLYAESHDRQDARRVDRRPVTLTNLDPCRLLRGGLDEHRRRTGVQANLARDYYGALGHVVSLDVWCRTPEFDRITLAIGPCFPGCRLGRRTSHAGDGTAAGPTGNT